MSRGATFDPKQDGPRTSNQLRVVRDILSDGAWHPGPDIVAEASEILKQTCSDSSITARIRDLRKPRHGGHQIDRRRRHEGGGLHEYRMRAPGPPTLFGGDGRGTLDALR